MASHAERILRGAASALCCATLVAGAPLGSAPEQERRDTVPDSGIEERVEVRVLQVSFVALDGDARPVLNLVPKDLDITLDGKPGRVAYLDRVGAESDEGGEPLPDARLLLKIRDDYSEAVPITNEPRFYLLLVDVENNDLVRREEESQSMQKFVDDGVREQDFVAVLSYNGSLSVEQAFTDDHDAIRSGIERAFGAPRRPVPTTPTRIEALVSQADLCEEPPEQSRSGPTVVPVGVAADERCLQDLAYQYTQEHRAGVESFLDALETAVRIGGGLRGRATVLVYSHGVSIDPAPEIRAAFESAFGPGVHSQNLLIDIDSPGKHQLDRILDLAARERVAFHFVDTTVQPVVTGGARRIDIMYPTAKPVEVAYTAPQGHLRQIAGATGGGFWETGNAYDGLRRALEAERGRYVLGLSLDDSGAGDSLPKVKISTSRARVTIVIGRSVRALPEPENVIGGRISPGDPIALPDGRRILLPFLLGIEVADVGSVPAKSRKGKDTTPEDLPDDSVGAMLSLQVSLQTADGRHIATSYHWLRHGAKSDAPGAGRVLSFKGGVEGPPGDYRLVAYVRNPENGKSGTIVREVSLAPRRSEPRAGRCRRRGV